MAVKNPQFGINLRMNENLRSEVNKLNATIDKIKNLKLSVGNSTPSEKVTSDKRYAGKDGIGEL